MEVLTTLVGMYRGTTSSSGYTNGGNKIGIGRALEGFRSGSHNISSWSYQLDDISTRW